MWEEEDARNKSSEADGQRYSVFDKRVEPVTAMGDGGPRLPLPCTELGPPERGLPQRGVDEAGAERARAGRPVRAARFSEWALGCAFPKVPSDILPSSCGQDLLPHRAALLRIREGARSRGIS